MPLQGEPVYDARYPARRILSVIADTWTPIVLYCLRDRTRRFNELQRSIPDISKKMLTQTLRKLEADKLVSRVVHPVVPPHVDYSLTRLGRKVAEAVSLLCEWATQNEETLKALPSPDRKSDAKRRTSSGARSRSAPARSP
ncbi:MAG TPA: helix-turn-helix domain-containing protein [Bryobacteraceae bacterium]|nr:helix-turn-helix domain-containing protein [Bryobacteraceae bacterium]